MVANLTALNELRDQILRDPDGRWELWDGDFVEKPAMSFGHNRAVRQMFWRLLSQLDEGAYDVMTNGRVSIELRTCIVPDLGVVPRGAQAQFERNREALEVYAVALPLVIEVWCPAVAADYDIDVKLPRYQFRGDAEIWRVDPFDRVIERWRRQAEGRYLNDVVRSEVVTPVAVPGVSITIAEIWE